MALRPLTLVCDVGHRRQVRRPLQPNLVAAVAQASKCHFCHPEFLEEVCPACLVPFALLTNSHGKGDHHASGLCFTCYQNLRRYHLSVTKAEVSVSLEHGVL